MSLYSTGIRPAFDKYLLDKSKEVRDYGDYWSASSAGYCMRKVIFERLGVPQTSEDARKQRVFQSGHIFHEFMQRITREAGLSIAQETELQDEELMIRGHIDDLVLVVSVRTQFTADEVNRGITSDTAIDKHLILYDYKTTNSRSFTYQKERAKEKGTEVQSYFHRMQLGTYMYMLRKGFLNGKNPFGIGATPSILSESRILKISKDDLRMSEEQLLWSQELENDVLRYWETLNGYWADKKIPPCTCADHEGGFMAKESYNPFFFDGEPCSLEWFRRWKDEKTV